MNISSMKFTPWHIPTDDSAFSKWRTFRKCLPSSRNRLGNCFKVLFCFCFQINFTKKYHKCYISVLHILYLAYFTCKVAAHSPDDCLSQWNCKEVCPGITFLASTRTSQMLLAAGCSFATLCFSCSIKMPYKSGKQNFSSPPTFTTAHFHWSQRSRRKDNSGHLKNKLTN